MYLTCVRKFGKISIWTTYYWNHLFVDFLSFEIKIEVYEKFPKM